MNTTLDHLDKILADFRYNVVKMNGCDLIILATLLPYLSVEWINWKGRKIRGWLESLVLGDTRMGKTSTAQRIQDFLKLGYFATGECTSLAGLLGGVVSTAGSNMIQWGMFAYGTGTLTVIDEASRLDPETLYNLNSLRSSGIATITKIVNGQASAATRKVWISNPRQGDISMYEGAGGPVKAVSEFAGHPEVLSRFDLVTTPVKEIHDMNVKEAAAFVEAKSYRDLVNFCWTRTIDQVIVDDDATTVAEDLARKQTKEYASDIPLVLEQEQAERLIRVAAALSSLAPTRKDFIEDGIIRVKVRDVEAADDVIRRFLNDPALGYKKYTSDRRKWERELKKELPKLAAWIKKLLPDYDQLAKALSGAGRFKNMQEIVSTGVFEDSAKAREVLKRLITWKLITREKYELFITNELRLFVKEYLTDAINFDLPETEPQEAEVV